MRRLRRRRSRSENRTRRTRIRSSSRRPTKQECAQDGQPDVFDQIKKLGELHELGFLSDDEFETKKADLLTRV